MAIVKQYHKDTNTTYVYDSESYWDPEKKQSRSRRKVIGKIDPDTGEIIPTGKRGRKKNEPATERAANTQPLNDEIGALYAASQEKVKSQAERIRKLEADVTELQRRYSKLVMQMKRADAALAQSRQFLVVQDLGD